MNVCPTFISPPGLFSSKEEIEQENEKTVIYEPQLHIDLFHHLVQLAHQLNKVLRVHFEITEEIWRLISIQPGKYQCQEFTDVVYDVWQGNKLTLLGLQPQYWLVYRQFDDQSKPPAWKLRCATRHEASQSGCTEIAWFETSPNKAVEHAKTLLGMKQSKLSLFDICTPIFGLKTTRIFLLPNLWIDFSSWNNFGSFGAYVVGTSHIYPDRAFNLAGIETLFDHPIRPAASKYLACALSTHKLLLHKILGEVEREIAFDRLNRYPVLQQIDGDFRAIHPYDQKSFDDILENPESDSD